MSVVKTADPRFIRQFTFLLDLLTAGRDKTDAKGVEDLAIST